MKNEELDLLKKLYHDEEERIKRIKELLDNENVKEYLRLTKGEKCQVPSDEFKDILYRILNNFVISDSNGIYVCTNSFYDNGFDDDCWTTCQKIDSNYLEQRTYRDIETGKEYRATCKKFSVYNWPLIPEFEKDKIILNPYNSSVNKNGYDEVRTEFFMNAFKYGQEESKRLILSKYPRL